MTHKATEILTGKVMQKSVLITGCSSGIGLESALELKRQGFHVLAGCRKPDDVERMNNMGFTGVLIDLDSPESVDRAADEVIALTDNCLYGIFNNAGFGMYALIDNDTVNVTNINRQIIALQSTVGMLKTEAAKARILDINPNCNVTLHSCFYTGNEFPLDEFDYIADAIDSVTSKLNLIENAIKLNIPIISSMGTGNKLDPTKLVCELQHARSALGIDVGQE